MLIKTVLLVTVTLGIAACDNTIRGIGKDVKDTGRAVEDSVK
nr:entericidin A/B family lipoprotein [Hartmannibacter diazotrophicus]